MFQKKMIIVINGSFIFLLLFACLQVSTYDDTKQNPGEYDINFGRNASKTIGVMNDQAVC